MIDVTVVIEFVLSEQTPKHIATLQTTVKFSCVPRVGEWIDRLPCHTDESDWPWEVVGIDSVSHDASDGSVTCRIVCSGYDEQEIKSLIDSGWMQVK
jgi:hypothetical protein